jgi:hypothetical protein
VPVDERDQRERLDIAHHRRKAADALLERAGRFVGRLGRAAVERPYGGRFLARDIPGVDGAHRDRQPVEDVRVDLGERGSHRFCGSVIGDVDMRTVG